MEDRGTAGFRARWGGVFRDTLAGPAVALKGRRGGYGAACCGRLAPFTRGTVRVTAWSQGYGLLPRGSVSAGGISMR